MIRVLGIYRVWENQIGFYSKVHRHISVHRFGIGLTKIPPGGLVGQDEWNGPHDPQT